MCENRAVDTSRKKAPKEWAGRYAHLPVGEVSGRDDFQLPVNLDLLYYEYALT